MSKRGMFIVIEGINGAGKSTLVGELAQELPGITLAYKFPSNKTAAGRQVIEMINLGVHQTEKELFQYLMVQDRIAVGAEIERVLNKGFNVIADRYTMSGVVYGAADGLDPGELLTSNSHCLKPDFCVLIDTRNINAVGRQQGGHRAYVRSDARQAQAERLFLDLWLRPQTRQALGSKRTGWAVVNGGLSIRELRDQTLTALSALGLYQKKEEAMPPETKQIDPNSVTWQNVATDLSRELARTRTLLAGMVQEALASRKEIKPYPYGSKVLHEAEMYLESKQTDTEGQQAELIGMLAQQNEKLVTTLRNLGVERPH